MRLTCQDLRGLEVFAPISDQSMRCLHATLTAGENWLQLRLGAEEKNLSSILRTPLDVFLRNRGLRNHAVHKIKSNVIWIAIDVAKKFPMISIASALGCLDADLLDAKLDRGVRDGIDQ